MGETEQRVRGKAKGVATVVAHNGVFVQLEERWGQDDVCLSK